MNEQSTLCPNVCDAILRRKSLNISTFFQAGIKMKILKLLMFCSLLFLGMTVIHAQEIDKRAGCDSCLFKINSLEKPYELTGKWLFSRKDSEQNKEVELDTADWSLIRTPGPWLFVDPGKTFTVGWYRGVFEFSPEMIGQKVVVFMNNGLSRTQIYLDGDLIFQRPDPDHFQSYYPIMAMPAVFTITKTRHVFAFRLQSFMMSGPYELPLQIQKFDAEAHSFMSNNYVWGNGGLIRTLGGYISLVFGLFFLLIYYKTKDILYILASFSVILVFPLFEFGTESFINLWGPDVAYILIWPGLASLFPVYLFTQYFTGWKPRSNKYLGVLFLVAVALFPVAALVYRNGTFILVSRLFILTLAFSTAIYTFCNVLQAYWRNRRNRDLRILAVGITICMGTGINDAGLDYGLIYTHGIFCIGYLVLIASILWVSSFRFANTFMENKKLAADLKVLNDNLEELVAERTAQLRQKTNDIQAMLENMPQGVLTVLANNIIHPEYSAYLETIFESKDIAGNGMMKLVFANTSLGADILSQVEAAAAACIGEDRMNFEFNSHLLVTEFEKKMPDGRTKSLELSWSPICDDNDIVGKLMLCVRDVTELKRLAGEAGAQKRELEIIGEILAVSQEKFRDYLETAHKFVEENDGIIRRTSQRNGEVINHLFRNMHTIKGNARTYGLLNMTNVVHETEQAYDELRKDADKPWEPDALLGQLEQVRILLNKYAHVNDTTLGRKGPGRRGNVERFLMVDKEHIAQSLALVDSVDVSDIGALRDTLSQVGKTLSLIGTEKIDEVLAGVLESLPSLAKELGKEQPKVTIEAHGIVVRNQISGLLKNLFVHLLRNSLDHGLESAKERLAAGKTAAGNIQLTLNVEDGQLKLKLRDDGRGLAIAKIRRRAVEMELLSDADASPETVAQMIFMSGFSTADKVTEVSGRGVGMDAVKEFLRREGGDVRIHFLGTDVGADFRAFEVVISLPDKFAEHTR